MKYEKWAPQELCDIHRKLTQTLVIKLPDGRRKRVERGIRADKIDLLERLISDQEMEGFWSHFEKKIVRANKNGTSSPHQRLFTASFNALRAAKAEFEPKNRFETIKEKTERLGLVAEHAKQLAVELRGIRREYSPDYLCLPDLLSDPDGDIESLDVISFYDALDHIAVAISQIPTGNPYLINRGHNADPKTQLTMYFVRRIYADLADLFGPFNTRPLADLAVLTGVVTQVPIDAKDVENALRLMAEKNNLKAGQIYRSS